MKNALKLAEDVLWMMNEYILMASQPKTYGTDMTFHRLDIHLIHSIGEKPGINVTELSKIHNITKSAVSQAVKKLEKRNLIERYKSEENKKEILFRLLEKGETAYKAHKEYHEKTEAPFIRELAEFTEEEARGAEKLIDILSRRVRKVKEGNQQQ